MKSKKFLVLFLIFLLVATLVSCGPSVPPAPKLEGISLDKEDMTIAPGEKYEFKLELTPTDIAIEDIQLEWESSDMAVATVSDGKVVGKADGTTVITVKSSEGITASCFVTVKKPSAYDKLTGLDKKVYDVVIDFATTLANPSSVSLKGVYWLDKELIIQRYCYDYVIAISGMNGVGGYIFGYLNWDGDTNYNYSSDEYFVTGEVPSYNTESIAREPLI